MAMNPEEGSTRVAARPKRRSLTCWSCDKAVRLHADGTCPACGIYNPPPRKESLGYRILIGFLWVDVAITFAMVIYVAASCS